MPETAPMLRMACRDLRERRPSAFGLLARSTPIVVSDTVMRQFGGAAVLYGFTFVGRGVLDAPAPVRMALLAHEWGHIAKGHSFATLVSLILLAGYIAAPHPLVAIGVLLALCPCLLWQVHPTRELEADQVAAELVGHADLAAALQWAVAHYAGGAATQAVQTRIDRLRAEIVP